MWNSVAKRLIGIRSTRTDSLWPAILLLIVAAAVPAVCVLWFMTEAMQNERLAVRQKLTSMHQGQLVSLKNRMLDYCEEKRLALELVEPRPTAPETFADLIGSRVADGLILYDDVGAVIYPRSPTVQTSARATQSLDWSKAQQLEFENHDPVAASGFYAAIAHDETNANIAARALQAQARCLAKAEQKGAAIDVLTENLFGARYRDAVDPQGRLIVPGAMLLALHLIGDTHDPEFHRIATSLRARIVDYGPPSISSGQRRFLMRELQSLFPDSAAFPTLEAEDLTADYLDSDPPPARGTTLVRSGLPDVWQLLSANGRALALFREERIVDDIASLITDLALPEEVTVEVLPPGVEPSLQPALASISLGDYLEGWSLATHIESGSLFDAAAAKQSVAYLWTGILVILGIIGVAALIARAIREQMRLARLKNDLVATVSHELKTPLSSIRLLVDTLMESQSLEEGKGREYLELIAKENARLSHLINNFLTFSRMQKKKQTYNMVEIDPSEIVAAATEALGEKFHLEGCNLDVEVASDIPRIFADKDALVIVLLNLLDNAYKYTEDKKHLKLRTYANGKGVCFEVQDNGIGLSRRAAKRIFDRFYQADQRLSRTGGGCGLGLSIVQSIVAAHGGSVSVESEPGRGSTFVVSIPVKAV